MLHSGRVLMLIVTLMWCTTSKVFSNSERTLDLMTNTLAEVFSCTGTPILLTDLEGVRRQMVGEALLSFPWSDYN